MLFRSVTRHTTDISFVIAKIKILLYDNGLSTLKNYYFWDQSVEQYPIDQLINNKDLKGQNLLRAFDSLMNSKMFLTSRKSWTRFLRNDLHIPNDESFNNLYPNLSCHK